MPGILDIIEDVAADPAVESSVAKLIDGLFSHLKDALATGNAATVEQAINDGVQNAPAIVAAVTANTPAPPAPPPPPPTEEGTVSDGGSGENSQPAA